MLNTQYKFQSPETVALSVTPPVPSSLAAVHLLNLAYSLLLWQALSPAQQKFTSVSAKNTFMKEKNSPHDLQGELSKGNGLYSSMVKS